MIINSFQGGFDKNLSYLVWCGKTKLAAIVDPSVEINPIIEAINQHNLILDKILITHTHHDHIAYLDDYLYLYPNIQILCYHKSNLNAEFKGIFHDEIIEVSTFRSADSAKGAEDLGMIRSDNTFGTIEEDAWRRDFTINALYYDISDF